MQIKNGPKLEKSKTVNQSSDPEEIRTLDLLLRRQLLYPAELRNQTKKAN